jgi:hypothetical protein
MDQITCWELAKEEVLKKDEGLEVQVNAKIMTAVMLTVGKIAQLPDDERKAAGQYLDICREKLAAVTTFGDSVKYLPRGYVLKVWLFSKMSRLYVRLYHTLHR